MVDGRGKAIWMRRFAFWNIWFWAAQHVALAAWFVGRPDDFGDAKLLLLYLGHLSIAALWLSCLAWWQSSRVEEKQEEDADVQEVLDAVREQA